jgi:MscS family membrane protein
LTDGFPDWAFDEYFENPLWQWIGAALAVILAVLVVWQIYRLGKYWDDRHREASVWLQFGKPVAVVALIAIALFVNKLIDNGINISGSAAEFTDLALQVVLFGAATWGAFLLLNRVAAGIIHAQQMRPKGIDSQLVRIGFRLLSIFAVVYLLVAAADAVGIPIAPLIAGLGVGGLAIALAVRPTLENVIGGLILFADKPVRIGDFCRYGDQIGTVEQIGLRSTRVRSLERTIVTIPNAEFSQMQLDNFAARDQRLLKTILQLRYETTPEQLRYVLAELRKMLLGHPMVTPDPARVRFVAFGAYSLDLEVFAYLRCQDQNDFLAIQEDIFLRMADIVKDAGSGFAFPSQTHYHRRDTGLDAERGQQATERVEDWRTKGNLPFPEFDKGLRWEMEDTLDYPPQGSPGYTPRAGLSETPPEPQPSPPTEPKRRGRRLGFAAKRR